MPSAVETGLGIGDGGPVGCADFPLTGGANKVGERRQNCRSNESIGLEEWLKVLGYCINSIFSHGCCDRKVNTVGLRIVST